MNMVSNGRSVGMADGHRQQQRRPVRSWLAIVVVVTAAVGTSVIPISTAVASGKRHRRAENEFRQTNLVSDLSTVGAQIVDQNLKNPWGLAASPTSPLWVADNNGNVATVYPGHVNGSPITGPVLTVPIPGDAPTGQVFNPTQGFKVNSPSGKQPAAFIFSSESGRITAWSMGDGTGPAHVKFTSSTAVYKGLAIWVGRHGALLYASNFHDGTVDVFNSRFHSVHLHDAFQDHRLPDGYAPFGIQQIHGRIYVSYAKQDVDKHDDAKGPGRGFIDIYSPTGRLLHRLASRGRLDSPWGMTLAPKGFGPFAGQLLVGNFGDGRINVFSPRSGRSEGPLRSESGRPIEIDGLWGLLFGNSATGGPHTLLFSAGINDEADGLLGAIHSTP
jgi:uncharacterized protein (TIGR03118 family)